MLMNRWKLSRTLVLIPLLAAAQDARKPETPAKVVFVCEHGSAKSVIAAAHFERLAREEGLLFEVVARGTTPDSEIPAGVPNRLQAPRVPLRGFKTAAVKPRDPRRAAQANSSLSALPPVT